MECACPLALLYLHSRPGKSTNRHRLQNRLLPKLVRSSRSVSRNSDGSSGILYESGRGTAALQDAGAFSFAPFAAKHLPSDAFSVAPLVAIASWSARVLSRFHIFIPDRANSPIGIDFKIVSCRNLFDVEPVDRVHCRADDVQDTDACPLSHSSRSVSNPDGSSGICMKAAEDCRTPRRWRALFCPISHTLVICVYLRPSRA